MPLQIAYMSSNRRDFADMLDINPNVAIQSYPATYSIYQVLKSAVPKYDYPYLLIVRNTDVLLLPSLIQQAQEVTLQLDSSYLWLIAAAGGRGMNNQYYQAVYDGQNPSLTEFLAPAALIDIVPDVYLVNVTALADVLPYGEAPVPNEQIEKWLIQRGYQHGYVTVYHPQLRYVTPYRLPYHLAEDSRAVITNLADDKQQLEQALQEYNTALDAALMRHCKLPSISIITRTQFTRLPLLRRLLTSISRAVREVPSDVECILATDVPLATVQATYEALAKDYPYLKLRLAYQAPTQMASRVGNLLTGIYAARHDYVWVIDDDDFVYPRALRDLSAAFFAQQSLFVVCSSDVIAETWQFQNEQQAVRSDFRLEKTYHSASWRNVFSGVNPLPICSYIVPRDLLTARVINFAFRHDLSEDYALLLLLLTAPQLPPIVEVRQSLVGISVRTAGDNVVNAVDRTHWLAQTHLFLSDLQFAGKVTSAGQWQLYTWLSRTSDEVEPQATHWQTLSLSYQERVAELTAERDGLRSLLAGLQARYATDREVRLYQRWKERIRRTVPTVDSHPVAIIPRVRQLFGTAYRMTREQGLLPMLRQFIRWLRGERRY